MDSLQQLRRLYSYDEWANQEVLKAFRSAGNPPQRSLSLMAHVLSAQRLWLERLQQQTQSYPIWPDFSLEQCQSEAEALAPLWRTYVDQTTPQELSEAVSYKNSKGESFTNSVHDILTHVAIHSAYHRGQIAAEMRAAGQVPAYTDFIHGVRQGLVE